VAILISVSRLAAVEAILMAITIEGALPVLRLGQGSADFEPWDM